MSDSAKPSPVELPCGADCQYSVPLENGSWEDWAWCTHPAGGGLIRHRRDCRWFRPRPAGHALAARTQAGAAVTREH